MRTVGVVNGLALPGDLEGAVLRPPQAFDFVRALWRDLLTAELQALAAMARLPPETANLASWELNAQELEALVLALKRAVVLGARCALALEGAR